MLLHDDAARELFFINSLEGQHEARYPDVTSLAIMHRRFEQDVMGKNMMQCNPKMTQMMSQMMTTEMRNNEPTYIRC